MCRGLRVLCAADGRERLAAVKRAAVGASWEVEGGAASLEELVEQLDGARPDVVVLDAGLGPEAAAIVRRVRPSARVVGFGHVPGADAHGDSAEELRAAILGLPKPGGPVRT